jgi:hypothetical protein
MADAISTDLFRQELLMILTETFESVIGIYLEPKTTLLETLETITAEEASRPISATCASIAAQVAHTRFYVDNYLYTAQTGHDAEADWGEIWRTVAAVTPEEWDASKAALRESYTRLRTLVQTYDGFGAQYTLASAFGVVAHSAFHLGQIRQALCTVQSRG